MNPITKLIFVDLDGSVAEAQSDPNGVIEDWLHRSNDAESLIVFTSSKTFEEIKALPNIGRIRVPLIVEGGNAIVVPDSFEMPFSFDLAGHSKRSLIALGIPTSEIRRRLRRIEALIGESFTCFSDFPAEDVARFAKLDLLSARRVKSREFCEGLALGKSAEFWEGLNGVFNVYGLALRLGGSFHTIRSCSVSKGQAARFLLDKLVASLKRPLFSIGVGATGYVDDLFSAVNTAYAISSDNGQTFAKREGAFEKVRLVDAAFWRKLAQPSLSAHA